MLVALVVPKRLALNGDGFNLLRRRELVHITKAFALQPAQRTAQLLNLIAHDMRTKLTIRAQGIAILTEPLR
jgi:hypothetical protein